MKTQDSNSSAPRASPKKSAAAAVTNMTGPPSQIDRRNGDMSAAIQSISNIDDDMDGPDLPSDPDCQAVVTDFLDFTEYLPSDMMRSLTLIGNLDKMYMKASADVHELTKQYGKLPQPSDNKASSAESVSYPSPVIATRRPCLPLFIPTKSYE